MIEDPLCTPILFSCIVTCKYPSTKQFDADVKKLKLPLSLNVEQALKYHYKNKILP